MQIAKLKTRHNKEYKIMEAFSRPLFIFGTSDCALTS